MQNGTQTHGQHLLMEKNCIRISNSFSGASKNLSFYLQKDTQQYGNHICTCRWFILQFCHNGLITVRTSNAGRFRADRNSWKNNKQKYINKNDGISLSGLVEKINLKQWQFYKPVNEWFNQFNYKVYSFFVVNMYNIIILDIVENIDIFVKLQWSHSF